MYRFFGNIFLGAVIILVLHFFVPDQVEAHGNIHVEVFYESLSPYGSWLEMEPYGYVWQPHGVYVGWRPYTYGHWEWTSQGWSWISHWEWGWAPFHYGRWHFEGYHGWVWIPMEIWAPAWVVWHCTPYYVAWAPLAPAIDVTVMHHHYWNAVPAEHFVAPTLHQVVLPQHRVRELHENFHVHLHKEIRQGKNTLRRPPDRSWIAERAEPKWIRTHSKGIKTSPRIPRIRNKPNERMALWNRGMEVHHQLTPTQNEKFAPRKRTKIDTFEYLNNQPRVDKSLQIKNGHHKNVRSRFPNESREKEKRLLHLRQIQEQKKRAHKKVQYVSNDHSKRDRSMIKVLPVKDRTRSYNSIGDRDM